MCYSASSGRGAGRTVSRQEYMPLLVFLKCYHANAIELSSYILSYILLGRHKLIGF